MNTAALTTAATVNTSTQNPNKQQKQTAKEAIAANVQALIEQLEQGHSRSTHCLPHRDGQISQLQLWQHSGDCTAEARRNPRCWPVCVEPAWPQSEEGRARHPHSRAPDRRTQEEG